MTLALPHLLPDELWPDEDVHYPESDGMPMAESDFQRTWLSYAVESLGVHFADRPDVYVSGNIFMYYEKGNPKGVVAPDVLVVMGAEKRLRKSYFLWREPKAPDWILEVTSDATRAEDQGVKRGLYAYLGVHEYFQFDPTGDYLDPVLIGYRLAGSNYAPILPVLGADGRLTVSSEVLGLDVRTEAGQLGFYIPATGEKLLTYAESERARRQAAKAQRQAERAQRDAERARRHAEQSRHQAEQAQHQAEEAQHQAEQAQRQAERERDEAVARAAALDTELRRLKGES